MEHALPGLSVRASLEIINWQGKTHPQSEHFLSVPDTMTFKEETACVACSRLHICRAASVVLCCPPFLAFADFQHGVNTSDSPGIFWASSAGWIRTAEASIFVG